MKSLRPARITGYLFLGKKEGKRERKGQGEGERERKGEGREERREEEREGEGEGRGGEGRGEERRGEEARKDEGEGEGKGGLGRAYGSGKSLQSKCSPWGQSLRPTLTTSLQLVIGELFELTHSKGF